LEENNMGCGCFTSHIATATATEPDPAKHVNYQLGMVLGVEDFVQEFAYLIGRDQWQARDLIGYGTARGLRVSFEPDGANGPRVVVDAGVALSPRGQLICVKTAQCASLNQWLAANAQAVSDRIGSPVAGAVTVYVTLCYRDCPTDDVPIPGEPCRSEDELKAPSRLADDFLLELRFDPPAQREEDAVRDFVDWIRQIEISDSAPASTPLDQFLKAIRDAAQPWLSPPSSPLSSPPSPADFMFGAPPAGLQIRSEDAGAYLRAAFRLWVTELRPKWFGRWRGCSPDLTDQSKAAQEDCVMLARLDIPVLLNSPGAWVVSDVDPVVVDEGRRPFVVHLRLLQEWLLFGRSGIGAGLPMETLFAPPPADLARLPEPLGAGVTIAVTVVDNSRPFTLDASHYCVICDTNNERTTINLPPIQEHPGRVYIIKRNGPNDCTINCAGRDTIDGVNDSLVIPKKRSSITIVADSASDIWQVISLV
jgi:hypothetical protein